jgi:hypothetical protein
MVDSLVLGNSIELLAETPSINPLCPGAVFSLQTAANFALGAPQPTTDFVASLILDGERPFGRRASNRTITLPVNIVAPNRQILAAAREVLESVVDQDIWTMTWTRDPGTGTALPMIIDCFRAQPSAPVYDILAEKNANFMQVVLTIPALPYGRSDVQTQMQFASPVPASPPAPPAPVTIDGFTTISSPQCQQSNQCIIGPNSCCWDPDFFGDFGGQENYFIYGTSFSSALNLTSMTSIQMYLGFGSRYYPYLEYHGKVSGVNIYITLTDKNSNTLSFSRANVRLPCAPSYGSPVFSRVSLPIPQNNTVFDYSAVTAYSINILNRQDRVRRLSWITLYVDNIVAYPSSQTATPVVRSSLINMYGLVGSARSPATLSFQQAPTAGTPTTITTVGSGTYTVPGGTAYLNVQAWGGGGPGATMTTTGNGGGGGGAEYAAETLFPAAPAQVIPYLVAAGGTAGNNGPSTYFGPGPSGTLQVIANGGLAAIQNSPTGALGGSGSPNSVEEPGGAGRTNPSGTVAGGGGSSGGTVSPGGTPMGTGSVLFTTPGSYSGSSSGWLCPAGVFQIFAEAWGGGGGGAAGSNSDNGTGGSGAEYRASFLAVTPGVYYSFTVGAGGAGGSGSGGGGQNGSAGGLSNFIGDAASVIAHAGLGGFGSQSNGPNGGSGGTGTTGFNGGKGGPAYPYTGGGGSSAGVSAAGNAGSTPNGATPPSQGGAGGAGSGYNNAVGTAGSQPGGGGGGTWTPGYAGGAGGAGQVRITYPSGVGAPTNTGAPAVTGGGAGGNGAATAGVGSVGAQPGGGGGGAESSGSTEAGGTGGAGKLIITPYASTAFKSLIVHRPPLGALKTFQPLVSVGAGSDVPNGGTQYTMPQPVSGVQADFGGTYTIYLINKTWNGSSNRTITVTVTQYEYSGGASYTTSTIPITIQPSQITNGIVTAGVLTLPIKAVAADNTGGYYSVSVTDTNTSDRFYDCIFLDTQGQTVIINEPSTGYITYYIDAPDPNIALGNIMGSQLGRADAISVMDQCVLSGGPLTIEPADGDNQLFVYSADASAPAISLAYFPCWYFDRTQ